MKPLLLTGYDSCLKTRDRRLVLLRQDSGRSTEWLPRDFPFDSIIVEHLGGFVTFPALRWLATNGVSLTALDFNGGLLANYLPPEPLNARDRLAQLQAFADPARRVEIARYILTEKMGTRPPLSCKTIEDLVAYEGRGAGYYWRLLGIVRDYPHARDPVNACLNYSYGLLESRARASVNRHGLMPEIGFLHTPRSPKGGKSSLCYDIMEPFRNPITLEAISVAKELKARDFGEVFGFGLTLRPSGAHRLVSSFAETFSDRAMDAFTSRLALRFGE